MYYYSTNSAISIGKFTEASGIISTSSEVAITNTASSSNLVLNISNLNTNEYTFVYDTNSKTRTRRILFDTNIFDLGEFDYGISTSLINSSADKNYSYSTGNGGVSGSYKLNISITEASNDIDKFIGLAGNNYSTSTLANVNVSFSRNILSGLVPNTKYYLGRDGNLTNQKIF